MVQFSHRELRSPCFNFVPYNQLIILIFIFKISKANLYYYVILLYSGIEEVNIMSAVKKTISIDEKIAEEASALNSNFSAVVEAALILYLHQYRVQKALESFGGWEERKESSVDIVNDLRREDDRGKIK